MPGMVEVIEEQTTAASAPQPNFEPLPVPRRPLLLSSEFSMGLMPDLVNSTYLIGGTNPHQLLAEGLASITSLAGSRGDLVILEDIQEFVRNVLFKDMLDDEEIVAEPDAGFDESLFALIPSPVGFTTGYQFDDFGGSAAPPIPVPEPSTALLMVMGLCGLAWSGRDRRGQVVR